MTRSAQLGDVGHNVGLITLSGYDNRLTSLDHSGGHVLQFLPAGSNDVMVMM